MSVRSGETRKGRAASLRRILRAMICAAALLVLSSAFGQMTLQQIAARFPDASRVRADYGDDSSRFAALNALLNALPHGRETYNKSFAYSQAINQILAKYTARGIDPQVRNLFDDRAGQLMRDQSFKRGVLEKYNVANLAAAVQPGAARQPLTVLPPGRVAPTNDLNELLAAAAPFWIGTLILMAFLPWLVMTLTGRLISSGPPESISSSNSLQLPESLREFKVLGERFALEMQSGQVIEEKTWSETYNSVYNSAPVIQFVGNQAYQTGGGVSIVSTTVVKDRVWVRTLNGGETAWNFTDAGFQTRRGQIVSAIARPNGANSSFLLVYNHTTGHWKAFTPTNRSQRPKILFPWIVTTLVGTAGFLVGVAVTFLLRLGRSWQFLIGAPSALVVATYMDWGSCLICAGIAAWFFARFVRGRVQRQRVKRFEKQYQPALIQYMQQATPALARHFGQV